MRLAPTYFLAGVLALFANIVHAAPHIARNTVSSHWASDDLALQSRKVEPSRWELRSLQHMPPPPLPPAPPPSPCVYVRECCACGTSSYKHHKLSIGGSKTSGSGTIKPTADTTADTTQKTPSRYLVSRFQHD
ncbi:hypothetical protein J3R30DRAFT_3714380 [Lentinula aciculospora]|uniref:Secreted protein n=1 Tax=Lentinula aciculospora TaxID=153920 RepID=A0A9W8ZWK5_9AGAR|nr:hypothetical protein J3R30DRAFT_3714380 [Lentinula aciculospora]